MRYDAKRGRARWPGVLYAVLQLSFAACGGGGGEKAVAPPPPPPPPPPAKASLSGFIADTDDGARVAGAVVTVGGASVTTQVDGRFSFTDLTQGSQSIRVTAPGFDALERGIVLAPGSNVQNLLVRRSNTLLESGLFTTWLPYGVSAYRGVFVIFYGGFLDARPMIRGDVDFYSSTLMPRDVVAEHRLRLIAFGRAHGFAVIGTVNPSTALSLYNDIRTALQDVSTRVGHAELAHAPLLIMGHSRGGCMAYQLAVQAADQVIGVLPLAASGFTECLDGSPDSSVPVYMVVGENDLLGIEPTNTSLFTDHRTSGALWSLAIEAGAGHQWPPAGVLFNWAAAVTVRRLPETAGPPGPVQLLAISESSGWLADRSSHAIAPFACFSGDKQGASWLPAEPNAREWQTLTVPNSAPVVMQCP